MGLVIAFLATLASPRIVIGYHASWCFAWPCWVPVYAPVPWAPAAGSMANSFELGV